MFTGATPDAARKKREDWLDKTQGWFCHAARQAADGRRVDDALAERDREGEGRGDHLEGSYRSKIERHVVPFFERVPLPELDEEMIEAVPPAPAG